MRSPIVLFLLVGLAYASNPGWKSDQEYIYKIHGRTLARAFDSSDQYSGISLKAKLKIQPRSDGNLYGMIMEPKYSQIHSKLPHGWMTFIPKSELTWRPLALSPNPFLIEMEEGVIANLVVNKNVPDWEANMLKGIVSQFQLNTKGKNPLPRYANSLPDGEKNSAVFVTMEDTVSGHTATLYEIRPLPKHIVQYNEEESRYLDRAGDGEVIEVVKHKNYSHEVELPSYFYGFGELELAEGTPGKPASNQMGRFIVRDTTSRAVLTGSLSEYTVQSSVTTNKVLLRPNFYEKQMGSVFTIMNATLESMKPQSQKIPDVTSPVSLGNLVYTYDTLSSSNGAYEKQPRSETFEPDSSESSLRENMMRRFRRDVGNTYSYQLEKPEMSEAPESPFLPYTTGSKGKSIKQEIDIKKTVKDIASDIAKRVQKPENIDYEKDMDRVVTLTSLIRTMNSEEVESVTSDLYTTNEEGVKRAIWSIYRDALSHSGTGPAFLCFKKCIETGKLKGSEASRVVATMAHSVREPTLQYMKTYFELIKLPQVQSDWPLNDTALLTFTSLLRHVYVDEHYSIKQYPEKSFGSFYSREGKQFIKDEVIPYLTEELNDAIVNAQTHRIHALIRALGNIADPQILNAFEPYFEGQKQVSQFQRFLMIIALEKFVTLYPNRAIPLLLKVYQNPGETQEVRMAAVYQVMRCSPSAEILQMMASYTHTDPQEQVNAAVKSSIESASELEGTEFQSLRYAAQTARPLLTGKTYSIQHGANYLRSYLDEELKMTYKQNAQFFGSDDALLPKGIRYTLRENLNGMQSRLVNAQAFISSLDELVHVFSKTFDSYHKKEEQQKGQFQVQQQFPWSSLYNNRILNMKPAEREQLEGTLLAEIGSFYRMFSFDNMTVQQLGETVREWEEKLNRGMNFDSYTVMNSGRLSLSFPTEMGLPFVFTRDTPVMVKVQGNLKAVSNTKLYQQSGKLDIPKNIQVDSDITVTVSRKTQSRWVISTPFDSQRYIAGYDKHLQVYVPVSGSFKVDVENMEASIELVRKAKESESKFFQYRTWPYTSKGKITSFEPLSSHSDTMVIKPEEHSYRYENNFGKEQTGIVFKVEVEHKRAFADGVSLMHLVKQGNYISALLRLWDDNTIQYSRIGMSYLPQVSPITKADFHFRYRKQYASKGEPETYSKWSISDYSEPSERQQKLIEVVSADINRVSAYALDATADFFGKDKVSYILSGAVSKSNMDPISRLMISYKNSSDSSSLQPYEVHFSSKSNIPNTNGLDMEYSFKAEPSSNIDVQFTFGPSADSLSKIDIACRYNRSQERKQYLEQLPEYQQCKKEMREGNKQMPACVNMTMAANLLDRVSMKVQYENLKPETQEAFRTLYEAIRFNSLPNLWISRQQSSLEANEIMMQARFHPDLKFVNVSVETRDQKSVIRDIPVGELARQTFVSHPVFHIRSRYMSYFFNDQYYRPMCVVDKTKLNTFSNTTYSASISKHWTVMLQYIPKEAHHQYQDTIESQLKYQVENYAVLVRQSTIPSKKDIKLTVSSNRTDFKVVDIELRPSTSDSNVRVLVQGNEVKFGPEGYEVKDYMDYIQIYYLPNGEVKVEVSDAFYILYDGQRARISVTNHKFKNSVRGLCGQFNGQRNEDFFTPETCFARDPKKFIRSYEVEGEEGQEVRREFSQETTQCVMKESPLYVNVFDSSKDTSFSPIEMNVLDPSRHSLSSAPEMNFMAMSGLSSYRPRGGCTEFKTKYVQQNGEICFTIHAVPSCSRECRASGHVEKNVAVHCVQKSHVAELWKSQIDNGSSPDFSNKKSHKSVSLRVPISCLE